MLTIPTFEMEKVAGTDGATALNQKVQIISIYQSIYILINISIGSIVMENFAGSDYFILILSLHLGEMENYRTIFYDAESMISMIFIGRRETNQSIVWSDLLKKKNCPYMYVYTLTYKHLLNVLSLELEEPV